MRNICSKFVIVVMWIHYIPNTESKDCQPIVNLKCPEKRYTYYVYHQKVDVAPGCPMSTITDITWSLQTEQGKHVKTFASKKRFLTMPAAMAPGNLFYQIAVTVKESNAKPQTTAVCKFKYVTEPPSISFLHGYTSSVYYGDTTVIDARPTKYFGNGVHAPILWRAKCVKRPLEDDFFSEEERDLCRKPQTCEQPPEGDHFTTTYNVCYKSMFYYANILHDGINISRVHKLTYYTYRCPVQIHCERNCDLDGSQYTNVALPVALYLKQLNNSCEDFDNFTPGWRIMMLNKNEDELTPDQYSLSDNNHRLIIKANQLQRGYPVRIRASSEPTFFTMLEMDTAPVLTPAPRCTISPQTGVAVKTEFKVECISQVKHFQLYAPQYSVYQTVNGIRRLITTSADTNFHISLAKGGNVEIMAHDIYGDEVKCGTNQVTVNAAFTTAADIDSAAKLIRTKSADGDPTVVAVSGAFTVEMLASKLDKRLKIRYLTTLMKEMQNFKIPTLDAYYEIADLTNAFLSVEPLLKDYRNALGDFCKTLSTTHVKLLNSATYIKYRETATTLQAKLSSKCAERLLAKEEAATSVNDVTSTEPTMTIEPEGVDEDKEDDDDYVTEMEGIDEKIAATEILKNAGLAIVKTINIDEERNISDNMLVLKRKGGSLPNKNINIAAFNITLGDSFKDLGANEVSIVAAKYAGKDFMLDAPDIIDINVYNKNTKLKNVDYKVEFPIDLNLVPFRSFIVHLPPSRDPETILNNMNVHRLKIFTGSKAYIVVKLPSETKILYGISVNRRPKDIPAHLSGPSETEFKSMYPMQKTDVFGYIAISPHNTMTGSVPYELRMINMACIGFKKNESKWKTEEDCEPNFDATSAKVICTCKSASMHSIIFKEIEARLEEYHDVQEMHVEDNTNYIIFLHVIIVLACFIISLAFTILRKAEVFGRNKIFFLSDNLKNDRFGYLLVVKTGAFQGAGTTANIMVKLFGTKGESKPHVLNYPDPGCEILQRDKVDWFALTNNVHLGDIESILLWTDSIGFYPTWNCEDVTVVDLQTRQNYYFRVETWLSALAQHSHFVKISATRPQTKRKENVSLTLSKHVRFHFSAVHTWNIFLRSDIDITYVERLTVILSTIFMTYSLCTVFAYHPTLRYSDTFAYGEYHFYTEFLWIPFIVSFPTSMIHLTIVYLLRHSEQLMTKVVLVQKQKRHSSKMRIFCLCILYAIIMLCMVHLLIFGFGVTFPSSYIWITVSSLSLIASIFIWENVFLNVLNIITARFGIKENYFYQVEAIIKEIERQRFILFRKFGELQMRPYFQKHYKILTPNEIFILRQIDSEREEVAKLLKDLCIFLIYILILYIICMMFFISEIYIINNMMRLMIEDGLFVNGDYTLEDVANTNGIYDYIEHLMIPTIHAELWYGNFKTTEPGLMADYTSKVLGVVQLRQQRRVQNCSIPNEMKNMKTQCMNYAPVFKQSNFYDGADIPASVGHFKMYDGSGYIKYLGRTRKNSLYLLNQLKKDHWIDINSEVLFIEFFTYNVNMNVFSAVRIAIEHSTTGHLLKSTSIHSCRLLFTSTAMEMFIGFLLASLLLTIIVLITKRFFQMGAKPKVFFHDFWNCLDIVLTLLIVALVAIFFHMKQETYKLLTEIIEADRNQFHNYFYLVSLSEWSTILYGILVCLSTVRLWKFLHFGRIFRILECTILFAAPQLLCLYVWEIVAFIMVTMFMYPIAGGDLIYFRTFYATVMRIYLASISFTEHLQYDHATTGVASVYAIYALFLVIATCLNNVYCTSLILNLELSRLNFSNRVDAYTIQNYTAEFLRFYNEKLRRHLISHRLHGGGGVELEGVDVDRLIYPKSRNHRYAQMVSTNARKMKLMKLIAISVVHSRQKVGDQADITDKDFKLMATILATYLQKDTVEETHVFFKMHDPINKHIKFVADSRILQMEDLLKKIVQEDFEKSREDEIAMRKITRRLYYCRKWLQTIQSILMHITVKDELVPTVHPRMIKGSTKSPKQH